MLLLMKATVDVPDELYRQVKAQSALQGRTVREVTIDLYRQWLHGDEDRSGAADEWLDDWVRLGQLWLADRPGATATETLIAARNRLHDR
jgi:hypothetical protein